MQHIELNKNGNAIDKVAFIFVLTKPFNDISINEIITLYQNDREMVETRLPRMQLQNAITIQVGNQTSTPFPVQSASIGGVLFDRLMTNGQQEWFANFANNTIIIGSEQYSRWDQIWSEALEFLKFFLPALNEYEIKEIGIEYIDRFNIKSPELNWKQELFCKDSNLLPKYIWDISDYWHVHQGYFTNIDNKQLNNVNINYFKDEMKQINNVVIQSHHKILLQNVLSLNDVSSLSDINIYMQKNHEDNKRVMCDLLSLELCNEINLKCESYG